MFNEAKHFLFTELVKTGDEHLLPLLLQLVNVGDQQMLFALFEKYVFARCENREDLLNFYLGYCIESEAQKPHPFSKMILRSSNYFLPLHADWFFRPLYYLEHLDSEATRVRLFKAICQYFATAPTELVRITPSAFLLVVLQCSRKPEWPADCDKIALELIDRLFFVGGKLARFEMCDDAYLVLAYKSTFVADLCV